MGETIIDVIRKMVNIFAMLRKSYLLGEHENGSETDPGFHERRFVKIWGMLILSGPRPVHVIVFP